MESRRKIGKRVAAALGSLALGVALLLWPAPVTAAVQESLLYCFTGLAPSLFPFMALTSFVVRSGAGDALGRPLGWLARSVFRLPPCCAFPILLSLVGGYPAGARAVSLLLERRAVTKEQAARMMLFCVNPGAAFVVTYLGGAVLHSFRAGWLLFFAVSGASLALGAAAALGAPVPEKSSPAPATPSPGGALTAAVSDACAAVVKMCACIVLFAGCAAILRASGVFGLLVWALAAPGLCSPGQAQALLSFLLEVTGGVGAAAQFQAGAGLFAFGLAYGGLCVHWQLFSLFSPFPGSKRRFFLFRALHGLLAAGLAALFTRLPSFASGSQPVFALAGNTGLPFGGLSATVAGGASLVLLCGAFLLLVGKTPKWAIAPRPGTWYNGRGLCPTREGEPPWGSLAKRKKRRCLGGMWNPAAPTAATTAAPGSRWCAPNGKSGKTAAAKTTSTTP